MPGPGTWTSVGQYSDLWWRQEINALGRLEVTVDRVITAEEEAKLDNLLRMWLDTKQSQAKDKVSDVERFHRAIEGWVSHLRSRMTSAEDLPASIVAMTFSLKRMEQYSVEKKLMEPFEILRKMGLEMANSVEKKNAQ